MKFKKIILLIAIILVPMNVFANDGETENLFINIDILEDGSINVKELANLEPSYNGRLRTIEYKNSDVKHFTGERVDFDGSDIYNGSSITNLKIYDIESSNPSFEDIFNINSRNKEYKETKSADNGDYGVYIKKNTSDGIDLKIFNPSSTNKSFYLEYTVSNVVVVHNDVAEIAWNILGNSYDDNIDNMQVVINLPGVDNDERVWLIGPLNGEIRRKDSFDGAIINYDNIDSNKAVSFRIMFDKNLVSKSTKLSGVSGKEKILSVEKEASKKANIKRNRIKKQQLIIKKITIVWYIIVFISIIIFAIKKQKNKKCAFNQEYYRDFPRTYGPEKLEYLIKNNITELSFSASILMMIEKNIIKVEINQEDKNNYVLIRNKKYKDDISLEDKKIIKILFDKIGDGNKVKLKEIKQYGKTSKNAEDFMKEYNYWKDTVKKLSKQENFFKNIFKLKTIIILIAAFGIIIQFINIIFETEFYIGYFAIFVVVLTIIYVAMTNFRTDKGILEYKEWMSFKKFLIDFGKMDEKELPEVKLWGKYLVYASVLGCAKKLEKTMNIKIKSMNLNQDFTNNYYNFYITNNIMSNVSSAVTSAVTSSITTSQSSSSGYGGGSSFGGGSFGGGGGGGHF